MNTVRKGDAFEDRAYSIIEAALQEQRLPLNPACCKIYQKRSYYSKEREGNIVFDLSIEVLPKGADRVHLLYLIECKDYKGTVPGSDVEEFISKMRQVTGANVKGVFITTGELQQAAYNLLKNNNLMYINVKNDEPEIILYNKERAKKLVDAPARTWDKDLQKLSEINELYEDFHQSKASDWDTVIEMFLTRELNAKVNWEQPGQKTDRLEFLSKEILKKLADKIINDFDNDILANGKPLPLKRFITYLTNLYGLNFVTDISFDQNHIGLNGYYDRKLNTIYINPELKDSGKYSFVCLHEISHFLLHKNLNINQLEYESQEDSKYNPITRKHQLVKEKHWIEWQANYLGACLLMPERCVLWQLIKWQIGEGISKRGSMWVDKQPCNIRDYKVAMTQLAYIFGVNRGILEFRMFDLGIIKYHGQRGHHLYHLFGDSRPERTVGQILNSWLKKYISTYQDLSNQSLI